MPRPDFADPHDIASGRPDFDDTAHPQTRESWLHWGGELAASTYEGAVKGVADMPIVSSMVSPQMREWAKTSDPKHPIAEGVGYYGAQYGPLALLPDVGLPAMAARTAPFWKPAARIAGRVGEGLWKGAVGGATQGDPETGAVAGGGSSLAREGARAAWRAMPTWAKTGLATSLPLLAYEAARGERGGFQIPWWMAHYLGEGAAGAAGVVAGKPGVAGALGAKLSGGSDGADEKNSR